MIPVNLVLYLCRAVFLCVKYALNGLVLVSYFVFKFVNYVFKGIGFIFSMIKLGWDKLTEENRKMYQAQLERKRKANEAKRLADLRKAEEKCRKIEEENKRRLAILEAKQKKEKEAKEASATKANVEVGMDGRRKRGKDEYINENVKIEKKKVGDHINDFLLKIIAIPKKMAGNIKNSVKNSTFAKNARNEKDIQRQALLINFEGEDAAKSEKKILYEYVARDAEGKVIKDYFQAFSKVEVHSFLLSEGYEVYSIRTSKMIQLLHGNVGKSAGKIKMKDLIFFLTQLSTYIKAGIPLVDALKILMRQFKNKSYKRIFKAMMYNLTMGDNFSEAMSKQGDAFPKLLINMVKTSELTGELPETLDDMANYYTEADKTRKQMVTAMIYPTMVFILAIVVVIFILVFVVPKFTEIYEGFGDTEIPAFTKVVMAISDFLVNNALWLILGLVLIVLILVYLYKNVKIMRTFMQWIAMHIPVFGDVIIYNEVTMFTKTFASLLSHNVFITDSMEVLSRITNNEVYKMLILDTITNLAKGERISLAFKDHWAFPIPAYEMLVTGEMTGQLPEMMAKVADYYQELHRQSVTRIKTVMEPALLVFLAVVVGAIILAIIVPMFSLYEDLSGEASGGNGLS